MNFHKNSLNKKYGMEKRILLPQRETYNVIFDTTLVKYYEAHVCTYMSCIAVNFFFSPTSDGSAAAILCSEEFVKKHNLQNQAVEIVAMEMGTDFPSTFKENSCMKMV